MGLLAPVAAVAKIRLRSFMFSKKRFVALAESSVWGALHRRQNSIPVATTDWHLEHGCEPRGNPSASPASVVSLSSSPIFAASEGSPSRAASSS